MPVCFEMFAPDPPQVEPVATPVEKTAAEKQQEIEDALKKQMLDEATRASRRNFRTDITGIQIPS